MSTDYLIGLMTGLVLGCQCALEWWPGVLRKQRQWRAENAAFYKELHEREDRALAAGRLRKEQA